jgi:uncharacterized protein YbjQ (UPF0145 family)
MGFLLRGMVMNTTVCRVVVPFFTILILGCTTIPKGTGESVAAGAVKIYGPAQLLQGKYETIKPLWSGSWRSAFWVPTYRTAKEGIAALQTEAAKLGANGLTNVACYQDNKGQSPLPWGSEPVFICYGRAVRVPNNAG